MRQKDRDELLLVAVEALEDYKTAPYGDLRLGPERAAAKVVSAVLASGLVASTRDMEALTDEFDRVAAGYREDEYDNGFQDGHEAAARRLRDVLRDPAREQG